MTAKKSPEAQETTGTTKATNTAPVFDISQFRAPQHYLWRKIEREGDDREPINVKLLDLTIQQTNDLTWGMNVALKDSMEASAEYVVEWDVEAENVETGEMVKVPPPSVAGWEVFELLTNTEASSIINWLKVPHYMKAEVGKRQAEMLGEDQEEPSKIKSTTTTTRSNRKT